MKKVFTSIAAGALLSLAGFANAAEPVQLNDHQMDSVSAGQTSVATSSGFALFGTTGSGSTTSSNVTLTPTSWSRTTTAGAASVASGVVAATTASAGSSF